MESRLDGFFSGPLIESFFRLRSKIRLIFFLKNLSETNGKVPSARTSFREKITIRRSWRVLRCSMPHSRLLYIFMYYLFLKKIMASSFLPWAFQTFREFFYLVKMTSFLERRPTLPRFFYDASILSEFQSAKKFFFATSDSSFSGFEKKMKEFSFQTEPLLRKKMLHKRSHKRWQQQR